MTRNERRITTTIRVVSTQWGPRWVTEIDRYGARLSVGAGGTSTESEAEALRELARRVERGDVIL